jgi:hypothetical protein
MRCDKDEGSREDPTEDLAVRLETHVYVVGQHLHEHRIRDFHLAMKAGISGDEDTSVLVKTFHHRIAAAKLELAKHSGALNNDGARGVD